MKWAMFFPLVMAAASACAIDVNVLEKLIAIPSVSANVKEVNRASRFMRDYLEKRGVHCVMETMDTGLEVLYASTTPGKKHDVVFSVHVDVVPSADPDHFKLKRNGDRIEGRGVRDCKGNVVAVAELLCELKGKNVSAGCIFGPDEEIGGLATRWMVETKGYVPKKIAIVVDSDANAICYAHKGQTYIRIKGVGRSGHSSRPWVCDDSITKVMEAYVKINEEWKRRHPLPEDKWSDVMVPTYIKADSGALNLIPGEVELILNLRSVNPNAKDELFEVAKSLSAGCEVEVMRHSPPVNSDPNNALVKRLQSTMKETLGIEIPLKRMLAATDARWFTSCGVPIVMVGSKGGNAHALDEFALLSGFEEIKACLAKFVLEVAK
ncbi:MAG: M20/M25/M40 family metallo-hydrolase [Kiritimatiellae bacterium]|nr:M20/M25/M40 family metallo-hydrolase [Kiritimatiellia bacterium]